MRADASWATAYSKQPATDLRSLFSAFFDHYAIVLYAAVAIASLIVFWIGGYPWDLLLAAFLASAALFGPLEYVLHRYVLHARFLSRTRWTSALWRRLHFDHHMDPTDLSVVFASPLTSLPLLVGLSAAGAQAIDRPGMFFAMLCASFIAFLYYEFMHLAAHMPIETGIAWLQRRRRFHMLHHHVDERVRFGIGTELIDRLAATRTAPDLRPRSDTIRNLGYQGEFAQQYPWVQEGYARKRDAMRAGSRPA